MVVKRSAIWILRATVCLLLVSCDSLLDVNDDPFSSDYVDANLVFTHQLVATSNVRTTEFAGGMGNIPQHFEFFSRGLAGLQIGQPGEGGDQQYFWSQIVYDGIRNLKFIEQQVGASQTRACNIIAQCRIWQGYYYYMATGLWEDVPFAEAATPGVLDPEFSTQEDVLRGIVAMMDNATTTLDTCNQEDPAIDQGDLVYNGDQELWRRFANSLKLKALMLLANRDAAVIPEIRDVLDEPLIEDLRHEAQLEYSEESGNWNPIYSFLVEAPTGTYPWLGNATFQEILQELDDPRLSTYYDEGEDPELIGSGMFLPGVTPGNYGGDSLHSIVSSNILRPNFPDRYMTSTEILLLKAECAALGYTNGGLTTADQLYRRAIRLSMDYFDDQPGEITLDQKEKYLSSLPDLQSVENPVRAIQLQLYIANFMRMPEAWIQWRRTKVPALKIPEGTFLGGIVRRVPYPSYELFISTKFPEQKSLDAPMWYEE